MNCLIDTHAFLWLVSGDPRLSINARNTYLNPEVLLAFSAASYWEICLKVSLGKLKLKKNWEIDIDRELRSNSVRWLPLEKEHMRKQIDLTWHHRDPFDRLLIAQAMHEGMSIISGDRNMALYGVEVVW